MTLSDNSWDHRSAKFVYLSWQAFSEGNTKRANETRRHEMRSQLAPQLVKVQMQLENFHHLNNVARKNPDEVYQASPRPD